VKQVLSSRCALIALIVVCGASSSVFAQTSSATPDPFVAQLTSSPVGGVGNPYASFVGDISANGRFVVFESNGDVATQNKNNADGNREIFLLDYAQRRIFQITNTKNVTKPAASPTPTPTPSASPTPSPGPTPADPTQIKIEITSTRPMISYEPALVAGKRVYTIVFSSNSPTLPNFDGTEGTLATDANEEIWIYQLPEVVDTLNLASGDDVFQDLSAGTFTQVTNTPASRPPSAGGTGVFPFVADDNREATISDDGNIIAFISTRSLVGAGNADGNPELFFRNLSTAAGTFVQATSTQDATAGIGKIFQQNPSLSATGGRVAFLSTANLASNNADGNGEVFVADFTGAGLSNIRQVTRTKKDATALPVNVFLFGRRLSRDGAWVGLESSSENPKADDSATNKIFLAPFVYNVAGDSFAQVGPRALTSPGDIKHFPSFTDYTGLAPSTVVFASALNFKTDGTFPAADQTSTGLNPTNQPQLFVTALPVGSSSTFARITKNPSGLVSDVPLRPAVSASLRRLAFSMTGAELGGGNADLSTELFYLLTPPASPDAGEALSFFTGASNFPVAPASAPASPSPSPTPTPTPGSVAFGLAPGELSIVRSTVALAPSDKTAVGGSETDRSPILPIELAGVSVSVNGAAAGLYFVGDSPAEGIRFVIPVGVSTGVATIVVNNNGTVYRGFIQIVFSQPDIFTSTNDAGGTAMICNITNTSISGCVTGPFKVTTATSAGTQVPTVLEIYMTGVRSLTPAETRVTIGTTDITATSVRPNTNMFGQDFITITLPSSLTPGDYPVVVTATRGTTSISSRGTATAPHVVIIP
jgi:uncharacterized protein (TIGR03437 family)